MKPDENYKVHQLRSPELGEPLEQFNALNAHAVRKSGG